MWEMLVGAITVAPPRDLICVKRGITRRACSGLSTLRCVSEETRLGGERGHTVMDEEITIDVPDSCVSQAIVFVNLVCVTVGVRGFSKVDDEAVAPASSFAAVTRGDEVVSFLFGSVARGEELADSTPCFG